MAARRVHRSPSVSTRDDLRIAEGGRLTTGYGGVVAGEGTFEEIHQLALVADHLPVLRAERNDLVTFTDQFPEDAFAFVRIGRVLGVEVRGRMPACVRDRVLRPPALAGQ